MKKAARLLIVLFLMSYGVSSSWAAVSANETISGDSIRVVSAPELLVLTGKWAAEYNRINPDVKIKVVLADCKKPATTLFSEGVIGFIPESFLQAGEKEPAWKMIIGRDVIVPVINTANPFLSEMNINGISAAALKVFLGNPDSNSWGTLLGGDQNNKISLYILNDQSVKESLSLFLEKDFLTEGASVIGRSEELLAAVREDPFAIGFCRLANINDSDKQGFAEGISLIPVDRNNNGTLDHNEKIYDDFAAFSRGIWIGKYPRTLVTNIYSVSGSQPGGAKEAAFLKWVLSDGQKYLGDSGYSDLLAVERQSAADMLYVAEVSPLKAANGFSLLKAAMIIIGLIIVAGIIADAAFSTKGSSNRVINVVASESHSFPGESGIKVPSGLYFDKTHTWAFMEKNGVVTVGIDDFLQHITGPISRIRMKGVGKTVKKGETILSIIQDGKQLNLYAPVSGTIAEQNSLLDGNSSLINESPYGEGWVYKIEPTDWVNENQLLFMAERQRLFLKKEFSRLKDFLATSMNGPEGNLVPVILQDGGEIKDGILSEMGPEVWEDFQTNFIDPSRQVWFYEIF